MRDRLRAELDRRPKVHGASADLRVSNELRSVLESAEQEMAKLKDEFTSAEHYLLALTRRLVKSLAKPSIRVPKDPLLRLSAMTIAPMSRPAIIPRRPMPKAVVQLSTNTCDGSAARK